MATVQDMRPTARWWVSLNTAPLAVSASSDSLANRGPLGRRSSRSDEIFASNCTSTSGTTVSANANVRWLDSQKKSFAKEKPLKAEGLMKGIYDLRYFFGAGADCCPCC